MDEYKNYIRVDNNNIVTFGYSDAFEQPITGDLPLIGDNGRHFQIQLMTDKGQYLYKLVNGAMTQRTQAELDAEWATRPAPPKSEIEMVKDESANLNTQMIDLWEQLLTKGVL